jgi:hypothetical protein
MDEPWSKPDLLFLSSALKQGMSFAEAAGFLCRDKDEVRKKAKELGLRERVVCAQFANRLKKLSLPFRKPGPQPRSNDAACFWFALMPPLRAHSLSTS